MIEYPVGSAETYGTINEALTEIEASHSYTDDGIADIVVKDSFSDSAANIVISTAFAGTASATAYIRIGVNAANRHSGHWDTAKHYITRNPATGGHIIEIDENYVHLRHLQIKTLGTGGSEECIRIMSGATNFLIEKCYLESNNITQQDCIYGGGYSVSGFVFDCVMVQGGSGARGGIHAQNYQGTGSHTWNAEHCTINGNGASATPAGGMLTQDQSSGTVTINGYNNLVYGNVTPSGGNDCYDYTANCSWVGKGNISGDETAISRFGGTDGVDQYINAEVDADNDSGTDVQITTVDVNYQIIDGADNGWGIGSFETGSTRDGREDADFDIAGNPRPGTPADRDAGAFQHIIAAAGGYPYHIHKRTNNFRSLLAQ